MVGFRTVARGPFTMTTASRTPEGEPNRCPVCRADVYLDPSRPPGDAPCPQCGHLLWFSDQVQPSVSGSPADEFRRLLEAVAPNPELADRVRENIRHLIRSNGDAVRAMFGGELSDPEILVLERLVEGKSAADIAAETGLYERAVRRVAERLRAAVERGPQG